MDRHVVICLRLLYYRSLFMRSLSKRTSQAESNTKIGGNRKKPDSRNLLKLLNERYEQWEGASELGGLVGDGGVVKPMQGSIAAASYFADMKHNYKELYPTLTDNPIFADPGCSEGTDQVPLDDEGTVSSEIQLPYGHFTPVEFIDEGIPSDRGEKTTMSMDSALSDDVAEDEPHSSTSMIGRGFYVRSSLHQDEYILGTAEDFPKDELAEIEADQDPDQPTSWPLYGASEPSEVVDLNLPLQRGPTFKSRRKAARSGSFEDLDDDWRIRYGSTDPSIPIAVEPCPGCGACFHCQDTGLPGFLPAEYFLERRRIQFRHTLCRRCYLIKHHDFLLNVSVAPLDYSKMMSHLKLLEDVLVILMVDMLDFPCSIYRDLPEIVGMGKNLVVLGNKIDVLPPDGSPGYLRRFQEALRKAIGDSGIGESMNVVHTQLVSAKTGYGIEALITYLHTFWENRGDVYLLGCTNVGKSTLFNCLLQSDMCRVRAVDLVERATTSIWPGTTLNLLKFPIMEMTPYKLVHRQQRLKRMERRFLSDEQHRKLLFRQTADPKFAVLQGYVGRSFDAELNTNKAKIEATGMFSLPEKPESAPRTSSSKMNLDHPILRRSKWCFDTPGTVHEDQIINYLTLDEIVKTVPRSTILPRSFVLRVDHSLLIGGLGRLDYVKGKDVIYCTVFASIDLLIKVIDSNDAESYRAKHLGSPILGVPLGDAKRIQQFPPLKAKSLSFRGISFKESAGDIVFSSAGWVAVTVCRGKEVELTAWTLNGVGIHKREPALLPFAVNCRGRRIQGTSTYQVNGLSFPGKDDGSEGKTSSKPIRGPNQIDGRPKKRSSNHNLKR